MSSLLKDANEIDTLIREMEKIESKLLNGQEILAFRDTGRIIAKLKRNKASLIEEESGKKEDDK
jgi:hypothetical protein